VKAVGRDTTVCLAAAHALVKLDDGTVVGDPMEKATLEALEWTLGKGSIILIGFARELIAAVGDIVLPSSSNAPHRTQLIIRRRFQFSSALKRMATISSLPGGKLVVAVKGAPETIKGMLKVVPEEYDDTYKWFTMRGSRVLALGIRDMEALAMDKVSIFSGFSCSFLNVHGGRSINSIAMQLNVA
jgi:cation-transporting ATPase 13A1